MTKFQVFSVIWLEVFSFKENERDNIIFLKSAILVWNRIIRIVLSGVEDFKTVNLNSGKLAVFHTREIKIIKEYLQV